LVIYHLTRCALVPSYTWCGAYRQIMIGLPSVIDCLSFFFLFSFMTTKVCNCPLYFLFVRSGMFSIPKHIRFGVAVRPKTRPTHLGSGMICQTRAPGSMPNQRTWVWQLCQIQESWVGWLYQTQVTLILASDN